MALLQLQWWRERCSDVPDTGGSSGKLSALQEVRGGVQAPAALTIRHNNPFRHWGRESGCRSRPEGAPGGTSVLAQPTASEYTSYRPTISFSPLLATHITLGDRAGYPLGTVTSRLAKERPQDTSTERPTPAGISSRSINGRVTEAAAAATVVEAQLLASASASQHPTLLPLPCAQQQPLQQRQRAASLPRGVAHRVHSAFNLPPHCSHTRLQCPHAAAHLDPPVSL
jgi:hypothetical protein